jgi:hypothetical protein
MAWFKIVLACIVAALIGIVAFYAYQQYLKQNLSEKLPETGTAIAFTERGVADTFLMSGFSFNRAPLERVGDVSILESKDSPIDSNVRVVLAQRDGVSGVVLGTVKGGVFESLLDNGTNKSDLVVTKDGIAVFAVATQPAYFPEEVSVSENTPDDADSTEPDEVGSVDGPGITNKAAPAPADTFSVSSKLFAFDIATKKMYSLGLGKNPRAYGPDAVVAIAPEGVVVVNVVSASRATLISYRNGDAHGSTLSPNGTIAAVRREGSPTVEVFRVTDGMGIYLGQIFSTSPMYGTAILGEGHIFVRTGKDTVALYALSNDVAAVQPHIAELGLLMPN